MPPRSFVAVGAVIGVLSVSTVVLAIHAAGEDSRTAESVCRSALLAITPTTAFIEPFHVRNLNGVDVAAEPQVAEVVDNYAPSPLTVSAGESAYIVQGDVRFGHGEPTALTCLVVLDQGKASTAPLFATAVE